MPQDRNFLIASDGVSDVSDDNFSIDLLDKLPPLQRFIFIMHTAGEYSREEMSAAFKFDAKTIDMALKAEETNIQRIVRHAGQENVYEWMTDKILRGERNTAVPASVDQAVSDAIREAAAPCEKKKKRRILWIGAGVLAACLIAVVIAVVIASSRNGAAGSAAGSDTAEIGAAGSADSTSVSEGISSGTDSSLITEPVIDLDESLTYYADIAIENYGTIAPEEQPVMTAVAIRTE